VRLQRFLAALINHEKEPINRRARPLTMRWHPVPEWRLTKRSAHRSLASLLIPLLASLTYDSGRGGGVDCAAQSGHAGPASDARDESVTWVSQHYLSTFDIAVRHHMADETVRKWINQGRLSAVRIGWGGRLFVDRRELVAFLKQLPKPGTKNRERRLKHRRMMMQRRLGRARRVGMS
jgi:hypothetical protein